MATDATGTPTSPDGIARILPSDAPAVTTLTSGVNAIADTVQTALTNNYLRKTSGNIVNADINAAAAIAYSKLNLASSITSNDIVNGTITGTDIASDVALAGNPTTTTQAVDNNTTRIATTGFVIAQSAAATPVAVGKTAVVGTSTRFARADHTHANTTGVYDNAGSASRLNPMYIHSYMFDQTSGIGILGDANTYMMMTTGLQVEPIDDFSGNLVPVDWDGLLAIGGTLQWRVMAAFTQSASMGSSAQTLQILYRSFPAGLGTISAASVALNSSFADGAGIKTFDTGFVGAPALTGQTGLMFEWKTSRTGGVVKDITRGRIDVMVRNV